MPPEAKKYLFDMQNAAAHIVRFTAGISLETYKSDVMLRSAVERQFQIVGEALFQLSRRFPEITRQVTDHRAIISFRHVLVHGYDSVRDEIVWGVIENDLPQLQRELIALVS